MEQTVTSKDGTTIAYERAGSGPALILVDGALCCREMGPMEDLARHLAGRFTVYRYDRRGRGASGDAGPWAIAREVEDLAALIEAAGGSAMAFGASSGAVLALEAAQAGLPITKLALYEAPLIVDGTRDPMPADFVPRLEAHLAAGKPGAAVKQFMRFVGVPGFVVAIMPIVAPWKKLRRMAPTLPNDLRLLDGTQAGRPLPRDRWDRVTAPALVLDGGKSPPWMRNAMQALAELLPGATYRSLPGQTHVIKAPALAPALVAFLA